MQGLALFFLLILLELTTISPAAAAYTVTPATWNIIGLDSNNPASGPYRFPVGAKFCGGTPGATDTALFTWETGGTDNGTYIYLRSGSANPVTMIFGADGCADAYFEAEVAQNSLAFNQTRRYYITAGGVSTIRPRELYVERLISQGRNSVNALYLDGVLVTAGSPLSLVVGNTYSIKVVGQTANAYSQFEEFINFSSAIFQILSVNTNYTANSSPYVSLTNHKYLYADACGWENDPNSPNYRSCTGNYGTGGTVDTTYSIKILNGTPQTLNSLLLDNSGGSFHYNNNYFAAGVSAVVINPANITISKSFSPNPTNVNGVSTLTFTLTNPGAGTVSDLNFTDIFPTSPGAMLVANPTNATTNGCGTPIFSPVAGNASISFSNGTIPANSSCTIQLNVTASAIGSYTNTSNNLFVGTINTGNSASATLTINNAPAPPAPTCGLQLAGWTMPAAGTGSGGPPPPYSFIGTNVSTATAGYTGTGTSAINTTIGNLVNSWGVTGAWAANNTGYPSSASPYFEFTVDTSKYSNTGIAFNYYFNGNWAGSNNNYLYVYSSANGGAFTNVLSVNPVAKNGWLSASIAANATGSSTTTFRINGVGLQQATAEIILDNVSITGCGVPNPPTITKSFSPNPVAVNATSTLTFTVINPVGVAVSGVSFTDILPAGLTVATGSSAQCGGTLTTTSPSTLSFASGTLAANASCTITATITATTAGPHNNVSGFVSSTQSGTNSGATGTASASLTALSPPSISKQFSPNPILAGDVSTLTFTLTNPNQNNAVSGVSFTDTFPTTPGNMTVASPLTTTNTCGGAALQNNTGGVLAAGAPGIKLPSGAIAAGSTCVVTVNVTAPSVGSYASTSGNVSHIINAASVNGNTAFNTLTVRAATPGIALFKQVGPAAIGPWSSFLAVTTGANVYYKFTIENIGDVPLSPVGITDPQISTVSCAWPASLPVAVAANNNHLATCVVGPITAISGSNSNTATAQGTYSSTIYNSLSSTARYATTNITIAKSATQTYFTVAGGILNYSYIVTNNGSAILSGPVTVADNKTTVTCPAVSTVGDNDNFFDPGESITCTATYTVVAADVTASLVTNTASATSGGVTSPTVSKTIPSLTDLTASKTNNVSGQVTVGNAFNWSIMVINAASSGSATFANTQTLLTDDLPSSGATYAIQPVKTSGTTGTGTINCSITSNTLMCTASGGTVSIPPGLQGTVSVANGSPAVTGTATLFTTQLTPGSVILISGTPYTVLSISSDTALTLTTNFYAATASGIRIPGSFSVPITVTATDIGSLGNPRNGGICEADPLGAVPETNEANNGCEDTVTVSNQPRITLLKTVAIISDPVNGATNPKFIPGAVAEYSIIVSNSSGSADNNSTIITDAVPANTALYVNDLGGAGSGPVQFIQGTTSSTLTYGFTALNNLADDVDFSIDGGTTWNAVPVPATGVAGQPNVGCDLTINRIRINPKGAFIGNATVPNPSFQLKFRACVQ